jgi:hypothetical protein
LPGLFVQVDLLSALLLLNIKNGAYYAQIIIILLPLQLVKAHGRKISMGCAGDAAMVDGGLKLA